MKTIGILGGMSWESTASYYRLLNQGIKARLGGLHSVKCVIHSVDFAEIEAQQLAGDWEGAGQLLAEAAQGLVSAGADLMIIATNTMHKVAEIIESAIDVPLIHIADIAAEQAVKSGMKTLGLLGTSFTMEDGFFQSRLKEEYDLDVIVPNEQDRLFIHHTIYTDLCNGIFKDETQDRFVEIIEGLKKQGADGAILGCTEIGLLVKPENTQVPLLDTAVLHVEATLSEALQ